MIIKERVKFTKVNEEGKKNNVTVVVSGRTEQELFGRIEKVVNNYLNRGYILR